MRSIRLFLFTAILASCASNPKGVFQQGEASWYGGSFHGRPTASGEKFNKNDLTAAHPSLPFGSQVKVVSRKTGKSVVVRINDRGPFSKGRIVDLSRAAAKHLGILRAGYTEVYLYLLKRN